MANTPPANTGDESPRDWRRRRRRRQPQEQPAQAEPVQEEGAEETEGDEEAVSRPLISLAEPALYAIGIFGAPLLIAGTIGLVTGIVVVAFVSSMRLYGYIDIAIGASLIGLVGAAYISTVMAAFISRTGRYGINTLILLAAFTGIVIILNFISFANTERVDVTATNQFSLSERTKDLLDGLQEDIRATAFYKALEDTPNAEVAGRRNRVVDTLEEFEARSGSFSFEIVDPDLEPGRVAAYFGARPLDFVSETVVVENLATGTFDWLQPTDVTFGQLEQNLVTSLYVATGQEQKTVYFLAGHGERNIDSGSGDGYALLGQALEQENYLARSLVWSRNDTEVSVPDDAALIVVAGPVSELPVPHAQALDLYLLGRYADGQRRRENGSLVFLGEPDTPDSWREFLVQWGIVLLSGYIRDVDASVPGLPQTLALNMEFSNIMNFNLMVLGQNEAAINSAFEAAFEIVAPEGQQLQEVFMPDAAAMTPLPIGDGARLPLGTVGHLGQQLPHCRPRSRRPDHGGRVPRPEGAFHSGHADAVGGQGGNADPGERARGLRHLADPGAGGRGLRLQQQHRPWQRAGHVRQLHQLPAWRLLAGVHPAQGLCLPGVQPGPQRVRLRPLFFLAVPAGHHGTRRGPGLVAAEIAPTRPEG